MDYNSVLRDDAVSCTYRGREHVISRRMLVLGRKQIPCFMTDCTLCGRVVYVRAVSNGAALSEDAVRDAAHKAIRNHVDGYHSARASTAKRWTHRVVLAMHPTLTALTLNLQATPSKVGHGENR